MKYPKVNPFIYLSVVTGCNPNDLDIWTDWRRLGLHEFIVYKSAEQEWSFVI